MRMYAYAKKELEYTKHGDAVMIDFDNHDAFMITGQKEGDVLIVEHLAGFNVYRTVHTVDEHGTLGCTKWISELDMLNKITEYIAEEF